MITNSLTLLLNRLSYRIFAVSAPLFIVQYSIKKAIKL